MKTKELLYRTLNEKDKNHLNFLIACEWLHKKMNNCNIYSYLQERGVNSVAIYGAGDLGKLVIEELSQTNIEVKYCIDNGISNMENNINIITKEDPLEAVDVIIVTPCFYFYGIEQELKKRTSIRVISLEKIIYEM